MVLAKNSKDTYKVGPLYPPDRQILSSGGQGRLGENCVAVEVVEVVEVLVAIFLIIQPAVAWPDHTARLRPSPKLENFLFDSLQHRLGG